MPTAHFQRAGACYAARHDDLSQLQMRTWTPPANTMPGRRSGEVST